MTNGTEESRAEKLKKIVLDAPYVICIERARYVTRAWRANERAHPSIRAARAFENTLRNMTVFLLDEELIMGNTSSAIVGTLLPVERGDMNVILEIDIDNLLTRPRKPYVIDPAHREELVRDILPYWRGRTVRDARRARHEAEGLLPRPRVSPRGLVELYRAFGPERLVSGYERFIKGRERHLRQASDELPLNLPNLVNNVFDVQGHLVIGNKRVLELGFEGIREMAAEKLSGSLSEGRRAFLESVMICCDAAREFGARFAALARTKAEAEENPARRGELLDMAARVERVPWSAPRNFRDAVQCVWFTQAMSMISYGMTGICAAGRLDQLLMPYYASDVALGDIDQRAALELIEELLIKLSVNLIMLPSYAKDTGSELGADSMAVTLGGVRPDGADGTNELSYLFLDGIAGLRAMSNSYSVRLHRGAPPEFVEKVAAVHGKTSGIALFNDDAIAPLLESCGCTPEHARDYAVIGCVEPTSQGNTFGCTSGNDVSLVGALEMTLNRGRLIVMGRPTGPDTGDPVKFKSFEQLMSAYRRQIAHSVGLVARFVNIKDAVYMHGYHNPFISATLEGCVENAEDMTQGGATYNFASIGGRGLGTAADSLAAIKKFVFDEGKVSMGELLEALRTGFSGREKLRRMLESRAPRYGRDDTEADEIARRIVAMFCEEVARHRSARKNGLFRPGFFSYGMHVHEGSLLCATPDGRPVGRPISNSLSPTTGSEIKGPTATMRSAAHIDQTAVTNGCSLNMKLMPTLLETPEGRMKFAALVRGYFAMGGMHVQFNVVDDATLRDAQRRPELYRDLIVRVSGYVAYFTDLGRPIQDDIIRRTTFKDF
ncbi:MAG TPA: pyruvate formate lyase family protein [bacterium]|nr:pyruvate formate lyase family protein [bacterium]